MHRRGRKVQPSSDDLGSNGQWAGIGLCIHNDDDDVYNYTCSSWRILCSASKKLAECLQHRDSVMQLSL